MPEVNIEINIRSHLVTVFKMMWSSSKF